MTRYLFVLTLLVLSAASVQAQKYFSRDARVQFNASSPLEKIEAVNKSGTAVIDASTGDMAWKVLVKNFLFEKALMQEHFNENYLESGKYPNATFTGKIVNLGDVNFKKDGTYNIRVKGTMEMHGVKKDMEVPGTITVKGGKLQAKSEFNVACADFDIKIPGTVADKIAKVVKVSVDAPLEPKSN